MRALILAAPRSGSGKTTLTLGLLRALHRRGVRVRAAKSGPDYIDPAFHRAACGEESLNLDSWAMPPEVLAGLLSTSAQACDVLVVESAMGLFDGAGHRPGRSGASADLAVRFDLPVLLLMDVSGHSQSAAAVLKGFATLHPQVKVIATIANRIASDRHLRGVCQAIEPLKIPFVGALRRNTRLQLPERHLGLVQAHEHDDLEQHIEYLADTVEAQVDLDALLDALPDWTPPIEGTATALPPPGRCIALAQDAAFSFIYPHLVAGWRAAGAHIMPFSPLANEGPPAQCDACWLPGGYPELHAPELSRAEGFQRQLRAFAAQHPVHGECGGYMVLGRVLTDAEGHDWPMSGLLSHCTSFAQRKLCLGYRRAQLQQTVAFAPVGQALNGHEYHYATVSDPGRDAALVQLEDGWGQPLGPAGGHQGRVSGTFFHAIALEPIGDTSATLKKDAKTHSSNQSTIER